MSSDNSGKPAAEGGEDPYLNLVVERVFRLESLVGIGTTGRVYRAAQLGFNRQCAIKVLHRHLMLTPTVRDRFHREARLLARLTHPGIVRVLASGELPIVSADVGGEAFLVSEYLEGHSVREWLRQKGCLSLVEALRVSIAVADAVAEAHSNRIVHRDLKPENLMSVACGNGTFRHVVLDFGLARALDREAEPLTREGAILGTPQYMAPEAARGEAASLQSDVYSLATILYELIAGHPPFQSGPPMSILLQQAQAEPPPLPDTLNVPPAIANWLLRQLSKVRENRCRDARQFAIELLSIGALSGIAADSITSPFISDETLAHVTEVAPRT